MLTAAPQYVQDGSVIVALKGIGQLQSNNNA
jgi:hypothetical protein